MKTGLKLSNHNFQPNAMIKLIGHSYCHHYLDFDILWKGLNRIGKNCFSRTSEKINEHRKIRGNIQL